MSLLQAVDLTHPQYPKNFFFIHWCGILLWVAGINMLIAAVLKSHVNQIHKKKLNHVNWFPWDNNHRDKCILPTLQHTPACRGSYKSNTINEPDRHGKNWDLPPIWIFNSWSPFSTLAPSSTSSSTIVPDALAVMGILVCGNKIQISVLFFYIYLKPKNKIWKGIWHSGRQDILEKLGSEIELYNLNYLLNLNFKQPKEPIIYFPLWKSNLMSWKARLQYLVCFNFTNNLIFFDTITNTCMI